MTNIPERVAFSVAALAVALPTLAGVPDLAPCTPDAEPRFQDFAVPMTDARPRAELQTDSDFSLKFRTPLREGLHGQPIGFAGHYVMVTFGCGTTCLFGGWIDVATGVATPLPALLDEFGAAGLDDPLRVRPESRLMVMVGFVSDTSPIPLARYYEWRDGQLSGLCEGDWTRAAARRLGEDWSGDTGGES